MTVINKPLNYKHNNFQRYLWWIALPIAVISLLLARRVSQEVRDES